MIKTDLKYVTYEDYLSTSSLLSDNHMIFMWNTEDIQNIQNDYAILNMNLNLKSNTYVCITLQDICMLTI